MPNDQVNYTQWLTMIRLASFEQHNLVGIYKINSIRINTVTESNDTCSDSYMPFGVENIKPSSCLSNSLV